MERLPQWIKVCTQEGPQTLFTRVGFLEYCSLILFLWVDEFEKCPILSKLLKVHQSISD
jgi:hypothetical protein